MKMSEKRQQELYNAIHESVMRLRILIHQNPKIYTEARLDNDLFNLAEDIWREQREVLGL